MNESPIGYADLDDDVLNHEAPDEAAEAALVLEGRVPTAIDRGHFNKSRNGLLDRFLNWSNVNPSAKNNCSVAQMSL